MISGSLFVWWVWNLDMTFSGEDDAGAGGLAGDGGSSICIIAAMRTWLGLGSFRPLSDSSQFVCLFVCFVSSSFSIDLSRLGCE